MARIVAVQVEDCGTCLQIEVSLARASGVAPPIIRAALEATEEALPPELAEVARFSRAVVTRTDDEAELRERLCERYGEEGLVELALGIASCRVFPTTKRALGFAVACERVHVEV